MMVPLISTGPVEAMMSGRVPRMLSLALSGIVTLFTHSTAASLPSASFTTVCVVAGGGLNVSHAGAFGFGAALPVSKKSLKVVRSISLSGTAPAASRLDG